ESSVGSGVRRIEAYVGLDAYRYLAKERALVQGLAATLKVPEEEVPNRVADLLERLHVAERELEKTRAAAVLSAAGTLADSAERIGDVLLVASTVADGVTASDLRALAGDIRGKLGQQPGVVALFSAGAGKVAFVVATTATARERGIAAGKLVPSFAAAIGGRGGGKPDMAQGGGTEPGGIPAAVAALRAHLQQL
ncbi:MAG: DHHA1 domain-containing protein, partial [Mycobacteriaceae bacterium]